MKYYIFFILLFVVFQSCGLIKEKDQNKAVFPFDISVKPNMSYELEKDITGALYPAYSIDSTKTTLVFTYKEKAPEGIADGDYKEEIYLVIPNATFNATYSDEQLKEAKMVFSKFCFCDKEEVGYRYITKGKLSIQRNESDVTVTSNFQVDAVQHKMTSIKKALFLKEGL